ncbi:MAG TPA: hypothetical protein VMI31_11320, partial [Fimbriimonadaceae bacterium]|nr:hypothetical protein [Fimbriimonadaceae bacterium]
MRAVSTLVIASAACAGVAQTLPNPPYEWLTGQEQGIESAFKLLRANNEILAVLSGTDRIGSTTSTLYSNAFFDWDMANPDSFAKAEINDYVNNAHLRRIVGDGTTLWSYDFARNSYTTFRYGAYSGAPPQGFRSNMLQELGSSARGSTVYLARLLKEVFSGDYAQYSDWFPGAGITLVSTNSKTTSMTDPIDSNRVYTADQSDYYVVYTYKTRPSRSAAFHFTQSDSSQPWVLSDIEYAERQTFNASTPRLL